ncbi:MAG: hypothetical protein HQK76_17460 [Desulfobacterales bacterium]|nr:hypothetical protein [Desulfobacterales bacterium]
MNLQKIFKIGFWGALPLIFLYSVIYGYLIQGIYGIVIGSIASIFLSFCTSIVNIIFLKIKFRFILGMDKGFTDFYKEVRAVEECQENKISKVKPDKCPKCGYFVKDTDSETECPKCGIIYSKFSAVKISFENQKNEELDDFMPYTDKTPYTGGATAIGILAILNGIMIVYKLAIELNLGHYAGPLSFFQNNIYIIKFSEGGEGWPAIGFLLGLCMFISTSIYYIMAYPRLRKDPYKDSMGFSKKLSFCTSICVGILFFYITIVAIANCFNEIHIQKYSIEFFYAYPARTKIILIDDITDVKKNALGKGKYRIDIYTKQGKIYKSEGLFRRNIETAYDDFMKTLDKVRNED